MQDLLVVVMTFAFFVVAMGAIRLCDRIIGPDDEQESGRDEVAVAEAVR